MKVSTFTLCIPVVTVQFQSEIGGQLFITLSTSLTAMPFTTSTYRKRERERLACFFHQSIKATSISGEKTKNNGRFPFASGY